MTASNRPDQAAPVPARCVDCGQDVPDALIFRVLRRDRAGRRHVVCQACADRRHGAAQPTPLQVQPTAPRALLRGRRRDSGSADEGGSH